MIIIKRNTCRSLMLILGVGAIPHPLTAQSIFRPPDTGATFTIESIRPDFDYEGPTFPTAGVFLTYRGNRTAGKRFILEVPLAIANSSYSDTEIVLGNPYIGIELGSDDSANFIDIGVRLPLTGKDQEGARFIGLISDFNQRMGAFAVESLWLKGGFNHRSKSASGLGIRVRLGPSVWIPTQDTEYRDTEFLMLYSAQLSQDLGKMSLWGALSGNYWISEKGFDFDERVWNTLGIGATLRPGSVQPGLFICLPLDEDMKEMVNRVVGLQVAFIIDQ
ncbi:hypothetical protein ACFL6T_03140 [Candidatus Zixiibacteriota bacterium]